MLACFFALPCPALPCVIMTAALGCGALPARRLLACGLQAAERVMKKVVEEGWWGAPLTTELVGLDIFYPAEDYHQGGRPQAGVAMAA